MALTIIKQKNKSIFLLERKGEDEVVTVYLVDDKLNVRYKYPYKAYRYEGDDEHKYLFLTAPSMLELELICRKN